MPRRLHGTHDPTIFRDRFVLVGMTAAGLGDILPPGIRPGPSRCPGWNSTPTCSTPCGAVGGPAAATRLVHLVDRRSRAVVGGHVRGEAVTLDAVADRFVDGADLDRQSDPAARCTPLVSADAGSVGAGVELSVLELATPAAGGAFPIRGTGAGPNRLALHRRCRHHHRRRGHGGISESDRRNSARSRAERGARPPLGAIFRILDESAYKAEGRSRRLVFGKNKRSSYPNTAFWSGTPGESTPFVPPPPRFATSKAGCWGWCSPSATSAKARA